MVDCGIVETTNVETRVDVTVRIIRSIIVVGDW